MIPRPFKFSEEDLAELPSGTRDGLLAVFGAISTTLGDVVQAMRGAISSDNLADEVRAVTLKTQGVVADSFPLVFTTKVVTPAIVVMSCRPKDAAHSLASPFVMQGFSMTSAGRVSVPFITGLLPDNTYQLAFWVRS